jgi:hypothetical protein
MRKFKNGARADSLGYSARIGEGVTCKRCQGTLTAWERRPAAFPVGGRSSSDESPEAVKSVTGYVRRPRS